MIYSIVKLGLLWGLIPALNKSGRPFIVAAIFAFGVAIMNFVFTGSVTTALIVSVIYYAIACFYYWLLDYYDGRWLATLLIAILLGIGVVLLEQLTFSIVVTFYANNT